ncbi:Uncharacterized protein Adt_02231 [Abeliophyllum distichum]|uniref:Uncharacterized protein n=1 Tax=Abeliophyllum distichum TaxID=126358 RepID=A0ABD1VX69_9LAMI
MEAIKQFYLKSAEAEKKGLSKTIVYLSKNTGIIGSRKFVITSPDRTPPREPVKHDEIPPPEPEKKKAVTPPKRDRGSIDPFCSLVAPPLLASRPVRQVEIPQPRRS